MKNFAIKNDLLELETLAEAITNYCKDNGIAEAVCYDVRLALEEAISNTIKYGYDDHDHHNIHVRIEIAGQELLIEIEDDATAFNPLEAPTPNLALPVEQKPIGSLGIYLMRTVMDRVEYERKGTKNILRLMKALI
jgi:anti-sigma regulatory factor (Ser/Thr protein kinase)